MIIDVGKFIERERPFWSELEKFLERMENGDRSALELSEIRRFHYLYQRASADLAEFGTFAHDVRTLQYLQKLVARAYGEVHEVRKHPCRIRPFHWFMRTFPRTFRRHGVAFLLSLTATVIGVLLGAGLLLTSPDSKNVIFPAQFGHLAERPSERVAREEKSTSDVSTAHGTFSAYLIWNNTRVSILAFATGITYGAGTAVLLFYNGVIMGGVCADYISDGQSVFLAGWLLPHGSVEIPAILIAGQAGFILAGALFGWGSRVRLRDRLRAIRPDLLTLVGGVATMLVWAGIVESVLSQYHEPVFPYWAKIAFGTTQLMLLGWFLLKSGRAQELTDK